MNYGTAAPLYAGKGWGFPFPLPDGQKYPPPSNTTGNNPDVDPNLFEAWLSEHEEDNLGLRMPTVKIDDDLYEVIGIDVDDYQQKSGWETARAAMHKLGELPETWRSSSRGVDTPSGIYFFLVPAGRKWEGKLGADVDVIQRTHRYAVAWPSLVQGRSYQWSFASDLETGEPDFIPQEGPPSAEDLPILPESWQMKLGRGSHEVRERVKADDSVSTLKGARAWMSENFVGYRNEPSSEMARVSDGDTLAEEATGGAHDMIVTRLHNIAMLAVEGHHGAEKAIERVKRAFTQEVLGELEEESARRDVGEVRAEFTRALVGEIVKVKQDIDSGYLHVSAIGGYTAEDTDIDTSILREKTVEVAIQRLMDRRQRSIDATDFSDNDLGNAEIFNGVMPEFRPIFGKEGWLMWNEATGRQEVLIQNQLVKPWKNSVIASLEDTSKTLYRESTLMEESGDDDGAKETKKDANNFARRARAAGNKSTINAGLSLAHSIGENVVYEHQFDNNPRTLGVSNGVIDLSEAKHGEVVERDTILRKAKPEDMVLLNTEVEYNSEAKSAAWDSYLDTFLPDLTYRRFVRKVMGYSIMGENPQRLIVFLQGGTSTGKSTLINAIEAAMGGYATTVAPNALFREKQDAGPAPEMVDALPKRVIFASEVGSHNRLHADVIKRVTGQDKVSVRRLYANEMVTRRPMFTPVIATNSMPTIQDGDAALWRRLLVLPFDHQVASSDITRVEDSAEGLRAVLAWLVEGWLDYLLEGLAAETWPAEIRARGNEFISGTSEFQGFVSEHLAPAKGTKVDADMLYRAYQSWCASEGMKQFDIMSRQAFSRRMTSNGYEKKTTTTRQKVLPGKTHRKVNFYLDVTLTKEIKVEEED